MCRICGSSSARVARTQRQAGMTRGSPSVESWATPSDSASSRMVRNLTISKVSPPTPTRTWRKSSGSARHGELVERDPAEQEHPHRRGDQQEEQVEQPLEVPLRRRHRLRQQQHERQAADLAQPVEPEERLAAGDPQQGRDVEPVEPADGAGVPLVEPGRRHEQHVAGAGLLGHLDHGPRVVDLGDDDELGDVGREVRAGPARGRPPPRRAPPGAGPRAGCAARARWPG